METRYFGYWCGHWCEKGFENRIPSSLVSLGFIHAARSCADQHSIRDSTVICHGADYLVASWLENMKCRRTIDSAKDISLPFCNCAWPRWSQLPVPILTICRRDIDVFARRLDKQLGRLSVFQLKLLKTMSLVRSDNSVSGSQYYKCPTGHNQVSYGLGTNGCQNPRLVFVERVHVLGILPYAITDHKSGCGNLEK